MNLNYQKLLNVALSSVHMGEKGKIFESTWDIIDEKMLYKYSKIDEVSSHVAEVIKDTNIEHDSIWEKDQHKVEKRINCLMNELESIAQLLSENNIKIVALKNAGIAKGIYNNYACSPMGDIDLLVKSDDFIKAHNIIVNEMCFTFKFRSKFENKDLEEAFHNGGSEYFKKVDGYEIWLELQWRPIAGRWIQPHNEPNGDELIDRSIEVKNSRVRILSPEDNLLQVALHTAKHSYVRAPGFRLHSDVDRIVRFQHINWGIFVKKVLTLKLKTAVYFSLYFAKKLLSTPIPNKVLDQLTPPSIRKNGIIYFVKKAGFYNQRKKKFSKFGYILFVLMLYDSISENIKAIFPPFKSIIIKYPMQSKMYLPYYYLVRFKDLLINRSNL